MPARAPTPPASGAEGSAGRTADPLSAASRTHIGAVDVVRFVTVGGVVLVHSTSLTVSYGSWAANGVLDVLHVTRSVFLLLSAFVLTYSWQRRPTPAVAFWRRRYPLVVVPYVVWSVIYVLTGGDLGSVGHLITTILADLPDARAHFHLYFLLLTMQLYLVFPAVMRLVDRHPGCLVPALAGSAVFELAFSACVHYGWRPPVLGTWFAHPDNWLPGYVLFVVGGIAVGRHLDDVTGWVRRHYRAVAVAWGASVALALGAYVTDITVLGYQPIRAGEVFQPTVVIEAVTATAAQFALGVWWTDRCGPRVKRWLERSSDVSFGVYLAHPLLIGAVLDVAVSAGVYRSLAPLPSGLGEALVAFGLVPFVYAVSFLAVTIARRTPASLALTGRKRSREVRV